MQNGGSFELDYARSTKRIVLVGRGGNGKSSCVRSITSERENHKGNDIIPVVCRGVGDTGEDRPQDKRKVIDNVEKVISNCDRAGGIDAIVFVMKYGVRFTKQEKDAVEDVKSIFGRDVFSKYGIIIMTYGDMFDMDNEEERKTFTDWFESQRGDIEKLFVEVNHRVILFDNRTNDANKRDLQYKSLYKFCKDIIEKYTMVQFNMAKQDRMYLKIKDNDRGASLVETLRGNPPVCSRGGWNSWASIIEFYFAVLLVCVVMSVVIILIFYSSK